MIRKVRPITNDPYDRPNSRWQNDQVVFEADAELAETTKVRSPSLRFRRSQLCFALTAFVFGAVLILVNSSARNEFFAPGPLSSNHAQILAGQGAARCAACHDAGGQTFSQWLTNAFKPGRNAKACQSDLCLKCHGGFLASGLARKPHNVDPAELAERSKKFQQVSTKRLITAPVDSQGDLECSACHREHHGNGDLSAMTEQQCQTCHSQQYHSFEYDHPEFNNWPAKKRQLIAFDHNSHLFKHFPSSQKEFDCKLCHQDDDYQNVKILASYEDTCMQCHQKDIDNSIESGLALISLPMVDTDAIEANKLDIGNWPELCTGDFDGRIPTLMRILLWRDNDAAEILKRRGANFEFADLDPDSPEDVRDAVQLVWSIKSLLFDLGKMGQQAVKERVEFAIQRTLNADELENLTEGLNAMAFAEAADIWIPKLETEIHERRISVSPMADLSAMARADVLLRYLPDESGDVLIENPLKKMLDTEAHRSGIEVDQVEGYRRLGRSAGKTGRQQLTLSEPNKTEDETTSTRNSEPNWLTGQAESPVAKSNPEESNEDWIDEEPGFGTKVIDKHTIGSPVNDIPESEKLAENPVGHLKVRPSADSNLLAGGSLPNDDVNRLPLSLDRQPALNPVSEKPVSAPKPEIQIQPQRVEDSEDRLVANPLVELMFDYPISKSGSNGLANDLEVKHEPSESFRLNQKLLEKTTGSNQESVEEVSESSLVQQFADQLEVAKQQVELDDAISIESMEQSGRSTISYIPDVSGHGWFRDDQLYRISYRPGGHADPWLVQLNEMITNVVGPDVNPATQPIFKQLTGKSSIGRCNMCHTIDDKIDDSLAINWKAEYRNPLIRSFTKFSHRPHVNQPLLGDCQSCHELDSDAVNAQTFESFDSSHAVSNFKPIVKANCTQCHFEGGTDNSCTHCHNYHVGSQVPIQQ